MDFISRYVREQKRYTKTELRALFSFSEVEVEAFIRQLKSYGILKAVQASAPQLDLTDLVDDDIIITDETIADGECFYVFTYVGVLTIKNRIVKCYPKYISSDADLDRKMKQVLKVLQRYGSRQQIINLYNGDGQTSSFNLLAVMLYLLDDYHQYGAYTNSDDIIERNGDGPILWEQTISSGFSIISNNRPYYVDFFTHRTVDDDMDFFHRLHQSIVSECSRQLSDAGILYLFDILEADVSEESVPSFGEIDYVLYRLQSELNSQYNTRKQVLLKTMYSYLANRRMLSQSSGISMYGTTSFNLVWERVCAEVFQNRLNTQLRHLQLPNGVADGFNPTDTLFQIIAAPKWTGLNADGSTFTKVAADTLTPDLVNIYYSAAGATFIIFDAKYYCIQLDNDRPLRGQPGVGDVTKQYLYQLAYKRFTEAHAIPYIKNCFLMPTDQDDLVCIGTASMDILDALDLQQIQVRLLPAALMFDRYLSRRPLGAEYLQL